MIPIVKEDVDTYVLRHTSPADSLLDELERSTYEKMELPQMLTGPVEGRFLKLLVQAVQARRVIEVGMFTGYATLSMASALPEDGEIVTCELEPKHVQFARPFFARSPHGRKIKVREGEALKTLKSLEPPFDFVFIDADKTGYDAYYEESLRLLRPGGYIALDNMLMNGRVLAPTDPSAEALDALNRKIARDPRVEAVLLTVRDGIQLVRKR